MTLTKTYLPHTAPFIQYVMSALTQKSQGTVIDIKEADRASKPDQGVARKLQLLTMHLQQL